MNIEVENISDVRAGLGTVLISPMKDSSEITFDGGKVYVNTSFQKEKFSVSSGIVHSSSIGQIQKGDVVIFHYLCVLNGVRDKKYVICNNQLYYSVNIESIYVVKRGEEIIPINGYMLVEPIKKYEGNSIDGILLPDCMIQEEMASRGIVRYIYENDRIKAGDKIIFRKTSAVPLEYQLHETLEKKYYRMKMDSVLALVL